jgi:hypothetical protein
MRTFAKYAKRMISSANMVVRRGDLASRDATNWKVSMRTKMITRTRVKVVIFNISFSYLD